MSWPDLETGWVSDDGNTVFSGGAWENAGGSYQSPDMRCVALSGFETGWDAPEYWTVSVSITFELYGVANSNDGDIRLEVATNNAVGNPGYPYFYQYTYQLDSATYENPGTYTVLVPTAIGDETYSAGAYGEYLTIELSAPSGGGNYRAVKLTDITVVMTGGMAGSCTSFWTNHTGQQEVSP